MLAISIIPTLAPPKRKHVSPTGVTPPSKYLGHQKSIDSFLQQSANPAPTMPNSDHMEDLGDSSSEPDRTDMASVIAKSVAEAITSALPGAIQAAMAPYTRLVENQGKVIEETKTRVNKSERRQEYLERRINQSVGVIGNFPVAEFGLHYKGQNQTEIVRRFFTEAFKIREPVASLFTFRSVRIIPFRHNADFALVFLDFNDFEHKRTVWAHAKFLAEYNRNRSGKPAVNWRDDQTEEQREERKRRRESMSNGGRQTKTPRQSRK